VAYPFLWGSHSRELIAASQSADRGNRLIAMLLIAGISFPLQFERIISVMPFSTISQLLQAYCR
jgi:hypothetical protein